MIFGNQAFNASFLTGFLERGGFDKVGECSILVYKNGIPSDTAALNFDGTGDYLYTPVLCDDCAMGAGDFTIECFLYPTSFGAERCIFDTRQTVSGPGISLIIDVSGYLEWYSQGWSPKASKALTLNTWSHVALVRKDGQITIYLNGSAVRSLFDNKNLTDKNLIIGSDVDHMTNSTNYKYVGYIDSFRITKGVARYTQVFTPPALPFSTPPEVLLAN